MSFNTLAGGLLAVLFDIPPVVVRRVGIGPTSASAASHCCGLSQLSVEAASLFGVTSFSGGLVIFVVAFSIWW